MLRKTPILSMMVITVVMAACSKNADKVTNPTNNNTLTGTWSLTGINVTQSTTMIGLLEDSQDSAKIVYSDNYPMDAVTGTLKFTGDSLYVNGLSYNANPQLTFSVYSWPGNVLDSAVTGQNGTISLDSTDLSFPYLAVSGKDSVSFPQGGIIYPAVGLPAPLTPHGATYAFNGDTVRMTMLADTTIASGIPIPTVSYFGAKSQLVLTLVKK
jgi:hypothetical protein